MGGSSNFTAALTTAQNQFASFGRSGAQKIIAVIGDGPSNIDAAGVVPKLDELAASGVHVFSIYFNLGDPLFMQSLVRNRGQSHLITSNPASIFVNEVYWVLNTIPGDYNYNGVVDGADYVWWRFN